MSRRKAGLLLGRWIEYSQGRRRAECQSAIDPSWSWLWREQGLCDRLSGRGGGSPRALSKAMLAPALEIACAEFMMCGHIMTHGEHAWQADAVRTENPVGCASADGLSFQVYRFSLEKWNLEGFD